MQELIVGFSFYNFKHKLLTLKPANTFGCTSAKLRQNGNNQ